MFFRLFVLVSVIMTMFGCSTNRRASLDESIPRVETPANQIAYIRTKWMNGKHIETVLYDNQDRVLEVFSFGRSSSKLLNRYKRGKNTVTVQYYHDDSSEPGFITITTLKRAFGSNGRVMSESRIDATLSGMGLCTTVGFRKRTLAYTTIGDTIITNVESSYMPSGRDSSQLVNIDHWERDSRKLLSRHYRLYVIKGTGRPKPDTIYNFSQRFAYNSAGKHVLTWFDNMYLGRFYLPAGPDTIWYQYDTQNRLVAEQHRYTTDMHNKKAIDTTGLGDSDKESIDWYRKKFFVGDSVFHNNNRVDLIRYRYEVFNTTRHIPLSIPVID